MSDLVFGDLRGIPEGDDFDDCAAMNKDGFHRLTNDGIGGRRDEGGDSMCSRAATG